VKRRLADDGEHSKKEVVRDGYGCVNYFPVLFPENETETEETLASKQQQLKDMYVKQEWKDTYSTTPE